MIKIYSVYDLEKEQYANPIYTDNEDDHITAERIFKAQLYDHSNILALFPDKFEFRYLGLFDELTGKFENLEEPEIVITGRDAVKELVK